MFRTLIFIALGAISFSTIATASFSATTCSNSASTIKYTFFTSWNTSVPVNKWEIDGKLFIPAAENSVIFDKETLIDSVNGPMVGKTVSVKRVHLLGTNEYNTPIDRTDFVLCTHSAGI